MIDRIKRDRNRMIFRGNRVGLDECQEWLFVRPGVWLVEIGIAIQHIREADGVRLVPFGGIDLPVQLIEPPLVTAACELNRQHVSGHGAVDLGLTRHWIQQRVMTLVFFRISDHGVFVGARVVLMLVIEMLICNRGEMLGKLYGIDRRALGCQFNLKWYRRFRVKRADGKGFGWVPVLCPLVAGSISLT